MSSRGQRYLQDEAAEQRGGGPLVTRRGAAIEHKRQSRTLIEVPQEPRDADEAQAMLLDPDAMREWHEILTETKGHSAFGVFALKQLAQAPWVQAIVNTFINTVLNFSRAREDQYGTGFQIKLRETHRSPTKAEKKVAIELADLITTCGHFDDPYDRFGRKHFDVFLQECTRDSLILDSFCFETILDKKGKYVRWWQPVDAAKIFRVMPQDVYGTYDRDDAVYVERWQEQDVAWWALDQLCYGTRRSRTDIENNFYGYPELAEMLDVVTGMTVGWAYNFKFFQNGGPRGALSINGEIGKKKLLSFQRQLLFAASGIKNAYRTLIVNPPLQGGIQWVPFGMANKEMEFSEWIDANFRLACAIFGIDPGVVGFHYGPSERNRPTFETNSEAKVKQAQSKGINTYLRKVEFFLNQYVLSRLEHGEDFRLCFLGDQAMGEEERATLNQTLVGSTHTLNEVRAAMDMEPLDGGDQLLPVYIAAAQSAIQMQAQQAMMAAQAGAQGGPNGDGAPPDAQDAAGTGGDAQDGQDAQAGADPATDFGPEVAIEPSADRGKAAKALATWEAPVVPLPTARRVIVVEA